MRMLDNLFLYLTSGTGKLDGFLNDKTNRSPDNHFIDRKPTHSIQLSPTAGFFKNFHILFQGLDWISLFLIIIGLLVLASSQLGNNGKWKTTAVRLIRVGFVYMIFYHVILIVGTSYGNFADMKIFIFILMLLGQILMYVASSTMFVLGSHDMEMFEMAGTPASERKKISAYNTMLVLLMAGAAVYFVAGMI